MRIAIYGATGAVGSRLVAEAASRGHEVTALSRHEGELPAGVSWQAGDLTDTESVAEVAAAHDVVVTANGPSRVPGEDPYAFEAVIRGVAAAVGTTRLVVVGGAGSLLTAPGGPRLVDTPDFPAEYRDEALASAAALAYLRSTGGELDWTYLSPAPVIAPGERTGDYLVSDETPAGDQISFEDYAVALLDEIETPAHEHARFTVANG